MSTWLSELFSSLPSRPDVYRTRLAEVDVTRVLRSCLTAGQSDSGYLTEVCRRSYVHPNGFVKLDLVRAASWAMRLHVWSSGVHDESNDPHDHRGFLVSRVLRGAVRNDEFERSAGAAGSTIHLRYRDELRDSTHRLVRQGEDALARVESTTYTRNDVYELTGSEIHRTVPVEPFPAETLVVEGPHLREFSVVYRRRRRPSFENVAVRCSPELFFDTLTKAVAASG